MSIKSNLSNIKKKLTNFRKPPPKGFKNLDEMDRFLKAHKVDIQDPFSNINPRNKFLEMLTARQF